MASYCPVEWCDWCQRSPCVGDDCPSGWYEDDPVEGLMDHWDDDEPYDPDDDESWMADVP